MRTMSISLLLITAVPTHALARERAGFVCTAADSSVMRLNIDLEARRFDDGSGWAALHQITDRQITLRSSNPDMLITPLGPGFATLTLDRKTLILRDETLIPDRSINRTVLYQCVEGAVVDFKAGRQF